MCFGRIGVHLHRSYLAEESEMKFKSSVRNGTLLCSIVQVQVITCRQKNTVKYKKQEE